jgi:sulfur-carrier protein
MESQLAASASNEDGQGPGRVTVRYWAAARAAAGRAEDHVDAATVAQALDQARRTHVDNPRFAAVLTVSSLLVGDQPIGSRDPQTVPLLDGDVIEVLPPFAGG